MAVAYDSRSDSSRHTEYVHVMRQLRSQQPRFRAIRNSEKVSFGRHIVMMDSWEFKMSVPSVERQLDVIKCGSIK